MNGIKKEIWYSVDYEFVTDAVTYDQGKGHALYDAVLPRLGRVMRCFKFILMLVNAMITDEVKNEQM